MLTDRYLYEVRGGHDTVDDDVESTSREERNLKVVDILFTDNDSLAFLSNDPELRQHALYGMFRIMSGWTRMPGMSWNTVREARRLAGPGILSATELQHIESLLAYYYVVTFADFFKRAPVLPHCL